MRAYVAVCIASVLSVDNSLNVKSVNDNRLNVSSQLMFLVGAYLAVCIASILSQLMTTASMLIVSFSIPWVYGASPIFVKICTLWVPADLNLTLLRLLGAIWPVQKCF